MIGIYDLTKQRFKRNTKNHADDTVPIAQNETV